MTIRYVSGDATHPAGDGNRLIVHVCNDLGLWGSGFVVAVSRRWPQPERAYRNWHATRDLEQTPPFGLGQVQYVHTGEHRLWVANMIAQNGVRRRASDPPAINYHALTACLRNVAEWATTNTMSVHMPRIGAGLAGGDWNRIEQIINDTLTGLDVTVYDLPTPGQVTKADAIRHALRTETFTAEGRWQQ